MNDAEQSTDSGSQAAEKDQAGFLAKTKRRAGLLYWRLIKQRLLSRRMVRWDRNHAQSRDDEENRRTRLPDGEQILWPGLWTIEIYGPSQMAKLVEGLTELGLDSDERAGGRDVVADLQSGRVGRPGGWLSAGYFSPQGSPFNPTLKRSDLATYFSSAHPQFFQLGGGITILVASFALNEENRAALDQLMRRDFSGDIKRLQDGGTRMVYAGDGKELALAAKRQEIRGAAQRWIAAHFPGAYAGGLAERMPSWDLLVTEKEPLFIDEHEPSNWRDTLGFGFLWNRWTSNDIPGINLCLPPWAEARSDPGPAFTGRRGELLKLLDDFKGANPRDLYTLTQELDGPVSRLLAIWALSSVLGAHERRFSEFRDRLGERRRIVGRAGKELKDLQEEVLPLSFDLKALARASGESEGRRLMMSEIPSFTPVEIDLGGGKRTGGDAPLAQRLQEVTTEQAQTVSSEADDVVDSIRVKAELLLATTNLRLQWAILALTIFIIGLTVVGIVVTATEG